MEGTPLHESEVFNLGPKDKSAAIELQLPTDKWWIIEFVSASIFLAAGDRFGPFEIWTAAPKLGGGTSRPHHFFMPQAMGNTDTRYCISQPTRLYAMPGSQVRVSFSRDSIHGEAHLMWTLSGRLMDT
jgi:hypothetical protein